MKETIKLFSNYTLLTLVTTVSKTICPSYFCTRQTDFRGNCNIFRMLHSLTQRIPKQVNKQKFHLGLLPPLGTFLSCIKSLFDCMFWGGGRVGLGYHGVALETVLSILKITKYPLIWSEEMTSILKKCTLSTQIKYNCIVSMI